MAYLYRFICIRLMFIVIAMSLSSSLKAMQNDDVFTALQENNVAVPAFFLSVFPERYPPYQVIVNSPKIKDLLREKYSAEQLNEMIKMTEETRRLMLTVHPWGTFLPATYFDDAETASETHYNAVWVRDSLWGYLALNVNESRKVDAKKILLTLWDYMSVPAQLDRMARVIKNPHLLDGSDGQMNAVHIRFDSDSPEFSDVFENGQPQQWNHKQNDALGLFLDMVSRAVSAGQFKPDDWRQGQRMKSIVLLVAYLDRVAFDQMPDSGAWEESVRLNTSSVGLVTSGLESLHRLMNDSENTNAVVFSAELQQMAKSLRLEEHLSPARLDTLINRGYRRITRQLQLGGESPDYQHNDLNYRTADAALLNLIYPARLSRLTVSQKKQVLSIVRTLSGNYGIKRYLNDNYQSANFWLNQIRTDTDEETHKKRRDAFIRYTEAQWFFDSWYAMASAKVYRETKDSFFLADAYQYMNRALGQITGENMVGANGRPVPALALPESYNLVSTVGRLQVAPSPITPLNWSKASLTLMLDFFQKELSASETTFAD